MFGRSAEEVERLAAKGIALSIIPGIATASGAVASAMQIPAINNVAEVRELE